MLLIDDDQPETLHRRKDRRTRAHHHLRLPRSERQPTVEPFALAQMTVPHHTPVPGRDRLQPRAQSRHGLRGERHLGHEKDHAAARLERGVDRPQVDLRFTRTRNPVQQRHPKFPLPQTRRHRLDRRLLLRVQRMRLRGDELPGRVVVVVGDALDPLRFLPQHTPLHQRRHHARRQIESGEYQRFFLRPKLLLNKPVEPRLLGRLFLQGGQFLDTQPLCQRKLFLLLQARAVAHRRRNHRLDDAVETARVIAGHPARQSQQVARQGRERIHHLRE